MSRPPGEHPLLWLLLAAGGGICLDRFCAVAVFWWCVIIAVAVPAFIVLYARRRTLWSAAVLLSCLAALAGLWHHDRWRLFPRDEIARFAQDAPLPVCGTGAGAGCAPLESGGARGSDEHHDAWRDDAD